MYALREAVIGALGICLISFSARAQNTDAAKTVQGLLQAFGPVPVTRDVTHSVEVEHCVHVGGGKNDMSCGPETRTSTTRETTSEILQSGAIEIVSSTAPVFAQPIRTELPDQITSWFQQQVNCGDVTDTMSVSISKQVQHQESISINKSITNTIGTKIGSDYTSEYLGVKFSNEISISQASTSGVTHTSADTGTDTRTGTGSHPIPAKSKAYAEFSVWPVRYRVPFSATVTVDSNLSGNDKGYRRLSDIVDVAHRTFPVAGEIDASRASDGYLKFYNADLSPQECDVATGRSGPVDVTLPKNVRLVDF